MKSGTTVMTCASGSPSGSSLRIREELLRVRLSRSESSGAPRGSAGAVAPDVRYYVGDGRGWSHGELRKLPRHPPAAAASRTDMGRFDILHEIRRLDPERDSRRILHLSFGYEFPWDSIRALEIALYRTYCVPSISGLLDRTGEFYRHPQRRYDDTAILIAELCEWGFEEGRGREALERINWAHGHYRISNEDFLYVLSTFVFEPIRWIDAFGWRRLCSNERLGYHFFWREVGGRMGIRDIPPSYEAFARWAGDYERENFRFAESNRRVGEATRDLFASWFPRIAAPLVRRVIHALLDDPMLEAFGFPRPLPATRSLVRGALRLRGRLVRRLPPRRTPYFFTDSPNRTYPDGYEIGELGPPRLVAAAKARERGSPPTVDT